MLLLKFVNYSRIVSTLTLNVYSTYDKHQNKTTTPKIYNLKRDQGGSYKRVWRQKTEEGCICEISKCIYVLLSVYNV